MNSETVWTFLIIHGILVFSIPTVIGWSVYAVIWNWHRANIDGFKMYLEAKKFTATEEREDGREA